MWKAPSSLTRFFGWSREANRNAELAELSLSSFKDILAAVQDALHTRLRSGNEPKSLGDKMMLDFAFGDIPGPLVSFLVPSLFFEDVSIRSRQAGFPNSAVA